MSAQIRLAETLLRVNRSHEAGEITTNAMRLSHLWAAHSGDCPSTKQTSFSASASTFLSKGQSTDHLKIGKVLEKLGDKHNASRAVRFAVCGAPQSASLRYQVAQLLKTQGSYFQAREEIEIAVKLRPWAPHYRNLRSNILGDLKVYESGTHPHLSTCTDFTPISGHVLHLLDNSLPYSTNGYSYRTQYVLQGQREWGLNPTAVTRPGFPYDYGRSRKLGLFRTRSLDEIAGVHHHRLPAYYNFLGAQEPLDSYLQHYAERVFEIAVRVRPEVIHAASDFKNGIVASCVARSLRIPWVYEVRGLWEDTRVANGIFIEGSEGHRFLRDQESLCMQRADALVTLSHRMKQEIISRGVNPEKIFVIPSGIDTKHFSTSPKDKVLASELKLGNEPIIGYIGTLARYEGLDLLLRAFSLLLDTHPNARLIIVGDGKMLGALNQLVLELGIRDAVRLTGRVSHAAVSRYYSLIDIFVVPRLSNRVCEVVTPIKPYEAMSMGCAVLVSDVGGLSELATEGAPVVSFKTGDVDDLAACCSKLINNPPMRLHLGAAASEWVRTNRTWHSNTQIYRSVYAFAKGNLATTGGVDSLRS